MVIIPSETLSDEVFRKDDASFFFEFDEEIEDPADPTKTILEPVDITDWSVYYLVKKTLKDLDEDAIIEKVITNHIDALNGKTIVELSSADTDHEPAYYYYIICVVTNLGEKITIVQDNFIIKQRGKE